MRHRTLIGFSLACLFVFAALLSANLSTSHFINTGGWTLETFRLRSEIDKLLTHFLGAQNNLRSYHLTKHDYFLGMHEEARDKMIQTMAALSDLTASQPEHHAKLKVANDMLEERLHRWKESFAVYDKAGPELLRTNMVKEENRERDRSLFSAISTLKASVDQSLNHNIESARAGGLRARVIMWLGGITACILIIVATWSAVRDNHRRQQAEDEMDRFFNLSLDLLCISGMDGYFKRLSPSYCEALGYSLHELYTRPITDFVHPDDIQKTIDEIAKQAAGNKVLSFENRYRHKDGSYRIFSWKSVPAGDRMYAVARDVTQEKDFESQLLRANEAAHAASNAKAAFLANMSHEIRTPLNGVVGMSDLLARTQLNNEQKGFVDTIRNSGGILLKIINEILDFSKIEAGRMPMEIGDFDLVQLVEDRISLVGIMGSEKGLSIGAVFAKGMPRLWRGDAGKIGQILTNLLNNSIKFTDQGFVHIDIRLEEVFARSALVEIRVSDSGIGMDEKVMKSLFEPFMQAEKKSPSKWGGTGLGLSITRKLLEMMNGHIRVESTPGQGTTFLLRIPLEYSQLQSLPEEKVRPRNVMPSPEQIERRRKIRILVAEDNRTNQAVVTGMLTALGYSSVIVKNGQEAVDHFKNDTFDIILMDQHMPALDGLEATRQIRALKTGKAVPIIAFTANVLQEDQKAEFGQLMDDFLLKPVLLDTLETVLGRWEFKVSPGKPS